MKTVVWIAALALLALANAAFAQDSPWPDGWIDLRADTIIYDFPTADSIAVTVSFTVFSCLRADTFLLCDAGVFLDAVPVFTTPLEISILNNECADKEEVDCYGDCQIQLFPSGTREGRCKWINDTLLVRCVCRDKTIWDPFTSYYSGETTIWFELDMSNLIDEAYEDNNFLAVSMLPVASESSTWGRIRKHFK